MYQLPGVTWVRFVAWLILGLVFYFTYGYRHSVLRRQSLGMAPATPGDSTGSGV